MNNIILIILLTMMSLGQVNKELQKDRLVEELLWYADTDMNCVYYDKLLLWLDEIVTTNITTDEQCSIIINEMLEHLREGATDLEYIYDNRLSYIYYEGSDYEFK